MNLKNQGEKFLRCRSARRLWCSLWGCALTALLLAGPAASQVKPWCAADPLAPGAQPYPAPVWPDLEKLKAVPDYHNVADNFRVAQSLRLLASGLEKAIAELKSGKTLAGTPDIDGACLCNCNLRDVSYWKDYLATTVKTESQEALQKTQDRYLSDVQAKIAAGKATLEDAIPGFRNDLAAIIQDTCAQLTTCNPKDPTAVPQQLYDQGAEAVQQELDTIFGPDISTAHLKDLETQAQTLLQEVKDLLAAVSGPDGPAVLAAPEQRQKLRDVIDKTRKLYDDLETGSRALANLVKTGNPTAWAKQVEQALLARLDQIFQHDDKVFAKIQDQVQKKIDERLQAIKTAALDIYKTATDGQKVLDEFANELAARLLHDLESVEGCYGITKRKACSLDDFCQGTTAAPLFGSDKLKLPLWIPTEVFKDGKTALRYALESIDWLEKVRDYLQSAEAPAAVGGGKLVALLKEGDQLLQTLDRYVNTFTEGYHLGAYSDIRPDLHMCVGWAGHGVFADVLSTSNGDFRGGADYLSANLVEKQRAQFRAGGFALYVNGHSLPLAPGLSLNLQFDGFRLWDRHHPFGLGGNSPDGWSITTDQVDKIDIFNLVSKADLENHCCTPTNQTNCILCPLTATSLLYTPFFDVDYSTAGMTKTWPRPGVDFDSGERVSAVFGAGLNLNLDMKTRYWSASPIPVFPGATLTPWLSLDAGIGWLYEANHLRGNLVDKINQNLAAASKLDDKDFERPRQAFQAPSVTEDVGNSAHVNPKLGADLTLGLDLARWLRIGVTANLYVGVDVKAEGAGGVLDLSRSLVETLAKSNPPGSDCKAKITENATRVCSNETYKKKGSCANAPNGSKDCIDLSKPASADMLYSTGTYTCRGDDLACSGGKGYCTDASGKIVLHDVTRDACEADAPTSRCVAVYRDNPNGQGEAIGRPEDYVDLGPPAGIDSSHGHLDSEVAKAQAAASKLADPSSCDALGWCYNWGYLPGVDYFDYVGVFLGTANTQSTCPQAHYKDGRIILNRTTHDPLPAQFIPFVWQTTGPLPDPAKIGRTFHPYQCVKTSRPSVSFEGPDCNPLEYGYPSACAGGACSCDPVKAPQCDAGRVCVEGACVTQCATASACGQNLTCKDGGCEMANGLPFAEQVAWGLRNAGKPQYEVASYSLDKLITSVGLGLGVRVGMDYKLFRTWRSKNLLDFSKSIPLVAWPFVKHQLGLAAEYQDDCDSTLGMVTNHQPDLVKRHPGGGTSADLVEWCKPRMAADAQNPAAMAPPEQTIGQGIEDTFQFATDVGLDFWNRSQLCVGGQTWDQYFSSLQQNPAALASKLACSYTRGGVRQALDCTSPGALQASLVTALGCLDAAGSSALPQNTQLLAVLVKNGQAPAWVLPASPNVFDLKKLLIQAEGDLARSNLNPGILALEKEGFPIDLWLAAINRCVNDVQDGGRYDDASLDVSLGLSADDFKPCGGQCCVTGECHAVASQAECGGAFHPGTACFGHKPPAACNPVTLGPPPQGACVLFGKCQEVASAAQCQGAQFYAGAKCKDLGPICATNADCAGGTWCRDQAQGGKQCVPFQAEGGRCGGNVVSWAVEICDAGLVCTDFPEPTGDVPGICRRSCTAPPSGLAAWWPLDEVVGPRAAEFLSRHDGRYVNAPRPVLGVVGRALHFNGVSDSVEVPDDQELNFGTGDFTFVTWLRTTEQRGVQSILDKRLASVGYHVFLYNGRLGLQLADGSYTNYGSPLAVADGQWHLVAITVERGRPDGIHWYLDGVPVGPPADPTGHPGSLSNASPLRFATRTVSPDGWWSGDLDEPALFSRALTAAEVQAIRLAGAAGLCKCIAGGRDLEAWWTFDDDDFISRTEGDSSGHGHDGTRAGGATPVPGRVGMALSFDGIDGSVTVPPAVGLDLGQGDFSLEGWLQTTDRSGLRVIAGKRGSTAGYSLLLHYGRLALEMGDGEFTLFESRVFVADGRWHHVAVTVRRGSTTGARFYLDGRQLGKRGNATLRSGSLDNAEPLLFATGEAAAGSFWKGILDEMTLSRRALAPDEITSLFRAGMLGRCSGSRPIVVRPFQTIERGESNYTLGGGPEITAPTLLTFSDPVKFGQFWKLHKQGVLPAPPVPAIDFNRQMVLVAIDKVEGNLGYTLEIQSVLPGNSSFVVTARKTSPGKNCLVLFSESQPIHIIEIEKTGPFAPLNVEETVVDCP
jgi:hypothetical protein